MTIAVHTNCPHLLHGVPFRYRMVFLVFWFEVPRTDGCGCFTLHGIMIVIDMLLPVHGWCSSGRCSALLFCSLRKHRIFFPIVPCVRVTSGSCCVRVTLASLSREAYILYTPSGRIIKWQGSMFGRYQGFDPKISEKLAADFANQWVEVRQMCSVIWVFLLWLLDGFKFAKKSTCWVCFLIKVPVHPRMILWGMSVNMDVWIMYLVFYMANPIISPRNMTHDCMAIWSPFFQVQGGWKSFCCSLWEASYTGSRTGCGRCGTCKGAGQDVQDFKWTCLISAKSIKSLHTMNANNWCYMAWILVQ